MSTKTDSTSVLPYGNWIKLNLAVDLFLKDALLAILHNKENDPSYVGLLEDEFLLHQALLPKIQTTTARVLKHHLDLLQPLNGRACSKDWDISLIAFVIIEFLNITPPVNGWKKVPALSDQSLGAFVLRAREIRNKVKHIPAVTNITSLAVNEMFRQVREVLVGLHINVSKLKEFDGLRDENYRIMNSDFMDDMKNSIQEMNAKINKLSANMNVTGQGKEGSFGREKSPSRESQKGQTVSYEPIDDLSPFKEMAGRFKNTIEYKTLNVESADGQIRVMDTKEFLVGKGPNGSVYIGYSTSTNEWISVKIYEHLRMSRLKELNQFLQFDAKTKSLRELLHGAETMIGSFTIQNLYDFNLMTFLSTKKPDYETRCHLITQLLCSLEYLHTLKPRILHHNLKPENIMIQENHQLFLVDFGVPQRYISGQTISIPSGHTGLYWQAPDIEVYESTCYTAAHETFVACMLVVYVLSRGEYPFHDLRSKKKVPSLSRLFDRETGIRDDLNIPKEIFQFLNGVFSKFYEEFKDSFDLELEDLERYSFTYSIAVVFGKLRAILSPVK